MKTILHLSIAGFIIKLVFHKSLDKQNKVTPKQFLKEILKYNKGFILEKKPPSTDFIIEFLEAKGFDIYENNEKRGFIHFYSPVAYHHISTFYHISRVQFIYILKSAVEELLSRKGCVIHCSASLVRNHAVVFFGKSGAGKTTISSMLQKEYPVLADDEGYIKREGKTFYFYQGPFLERSYSFAKTSTRYPIAAAYILEQGKNCTISKPTKDEISKISLQFTSTQELSVVNKSLFSMKNNIPVQKLVFTKKKEELMNCIFNHAPFNDATGLDTK